MFLTKKIDRVKTNRKFLIGQFQPIRYLLSCAPQFHEALELIIDSTNLILIIIKI